MKLIFTTLALTFILIQSYQAQSDDYRLTQGPIMKASLRSLFTGFIFVDENMMIGTAFEKGKIQLEKYNKDLSLESKVAVKTNLSIEKKNAKYLSPLTLNDKVYLLYEITDKKTDQVKLLAFELDKNSLQMATDYTVLAESNHKTKLKLGIVANLYPSSPFNIHVSKDRERFVVLTDSELSKKANKTFDVNVFDFNMTKKWSKNIEIPYPEGKFTTKSFDVDLKNNVYITGSYRETSSTKDEEYVLLRLSEKNDVAEELIIPKIIEGNEITRFNFYVNKNTNDLQVSGFYIVDERKSKENGFYYFGIDQKTFTINKTKFFPAKEILEESSEAMDDDNNSKRKEKQQKQEAKNFATRYELRNIVYKAGGGITLYFERFWQYTTTTTRTDSQGRTTTTTTDHYHYDDVIAINLNQDGDMIWARKIPKSQYSKNDGGTYSSFALMPGKDKLYMFFNDHIKNVGVVNSSSVYGSFPKKQNATTAIVTMMNDGTHTRETLVSLEESDLRAIPKFSHQISDTKMLLYFRFMGKQRFMIFEVL